jgi:hypothetical protein
VRACSASAAVRRIQALTMASNMTAVMALLANFPIANPRRIMCR